jgi:hypothetical protein
MRVAAVLAALALVAAAGASAWSCTTLSGDCNLNLDCSNTPVPNCAGVLGTDVCSTCLAGFCCKEMADCYADMECLYGCFEGFWPVDPQCSGAPSVTPFKAVAACQAQYCAAECAAKDTCNPVLANSCKGTTCDALYPGVFGCTYNSGAPSPLCQKCDPVNTPFCGAGLHCFPKSSTCAAYCCDDGDCGAAGKCILDQTVDFGQPLPVTKIKVGLCLTPDMAMPDCTAPAVAPSMGSCVPKL